MRPSKRLYTLGLVIGITVLGLGVGGTSAAAEPLEQIHFQDVGSDVDDGYCGLTVRLEWNFQGTFLMNAHGAAGLAYGMETLHGTFAVTNLANGETLTEYRNQVSKDLKVTDNGDGTLTIISMLAGVHTVNGPDGKVLLINSGRSTFEILIDDAGTPTDPTDDEFIDEWLISGRTGLTQLDGRDYCTDVQEFIG